MLNKLSPGFQSSRGLSPGRKQQLWLPNGGENAQQRWDGDITIVEGLVPANWVDFSVDFSWRFHQTFKVCWQNSWLCCVHGNTLLFVSFHCWRLRQVDYSKSASRFLLLSKPLTVDSYFITYHMFNLHEETEQQKFKCCLQSHSVLALDRKMKHFFWYLDFWVWKSCKNWNRSWFQ